MPAHNPRLGKRQWWVFRLTRRWDFISMTYEFDGEGAPDENWLEDLKAEFGHYLIHDSPRVFDPDDPTAWTEGMPDVIW